MDPEVKDRLDRFNRLSSEGRSVILALIDLLLEGDQSAQKPSRDPSPKDD